jgi:cobalt/nickel transport system permease protein
MIVLRIPAKLVIVRILGPVGIVSALVAVQAFSAPGHGLFSFSIFGWTLIATREGFAHGVLLGTRVIGAVSVVLLLGSVTPAHKIFYALRWFKVPETWVEIALLIYRYSFTLADQTVDVAEAQKLRLGYSGVRKSISSMGVLAGTVITRSMDQAMRTYEAMTLRGYHGKLIFDPLPKMTGTEITGLLIGAPVVLMSYVLVEWLFR